MVELKTSKLENGVQNLALSCGILVIKNPDTCLKNW